MLSFSSASILYLNSYGEYNSTCAFYLQKCPACQTPQPGCEAEAAKEDAAKPDVKMSTGGGFSFGGASGGSGFSSFGSTGSGSKPGVSFSFGNTPQKDETKKDDKAEDTKCSGTSADKTPQSGFQFGLSSFSTQPPAPAASSTPTAVFGSTSFGSGSTPSFAAPNVSGGSIVSGQSKAATTSAGTPATSSASAPSKPVTDLRSLISQNDEDEDEANKPKTVFGGFTFSSTPVVSSTEDPKDSKKTDEKAKADPKKTDPKTDPKPDNPFASFSFGTAARSTAPKFGGSSGALDLTDKSKGDASAKATATPKVTPFGGSASTGNLSFASVAASGKF